MSKKVYTKLFEWQQKCISGNEKCADCGDTRLLTVEHVVPCWILERFEVIGDVLYQYKYNREDNFRILCKDCNTKKGSHIDVKNPLTYKLIREILDNAEKHYKDYLK